MCSVGKGRQIAALIKQHWADGGRRALWVSVSAGAPCSRGRSVCVCWTHCVLLLAAANSCVDISVASSQDHFYSATHTISHHPSEDLRHDAARDLKDVLASHIPICPRVRAGFSPGALVRMGWDCGRQLVALTTP